MSVFKSLNVRPIQETDVPALEIFRKQYFDANIEIPHGYQGIGVETAVAEKDGTLIGGLTATKVAVFDFIHDETTGGPEVFAAVLMLERALSYVAQQAGMATGYVAIPSHLTGYIDMVKRCGYEESFQNCTILRRDLRTPIVASLGDARDAAVSK